MARENLIAVSTASLPFCRREVWHFPRSPSGMIAGHLLRQLDALGVGDVGRVHDHVRLPADRLEHLGWRRPTELTATPADMSMYRLPSGSLTVTPLPLLHDDGEAASAAGERLVRGGVRHPPLAPAGRGPRSPSSAHRARTTPSTRIRDHAASSSTTCSACRRCRPEPLSWSKTTERSVESLLSAEL